MTKQMIVRLWGQGFHAKLLTLLPFHQQSAIGVVIGQVQEVSFTRKLQIPDQLRGVADPKAKGNGGAHIAQNNVTALKGGFAQILACQRQAKAVFAQLGQAFGYHPTGQVVPFTHRYEIRVAAVFRLALPAKGGVAKRGEDLPQNEHMV